MSYQTIVVHVDDSARAAERTGVAARLARHWNGHVVAVAPTGLARFLHDAVYDAQPQAGDPVLALHLSLLRERARHALSAAARSLDACGTASFETRVIDDEPGAGVCLQARCADLVVIGQHDAAHPAPMADFPGHVVHHAGCPVLLVPCAGGCTAPARRVLLAWDGSREAARATSAALPLLQQAHSVHAVTFMRDGTHSEATAAPPLAPFLARHRVSVDVMTRSLGGRPAWHGEVAEALLALAAELAADLLVMGAYGHARLRETILGGVTRGVLETMKLPVLMAH
jgi:nucleotide-binding universal stress UspA family protein